MTIRRGKDSVHSQVGVMVGFVSSEDTGKPEAMTVNFVDWCSKANRRIVESSFAAETHAAVVGVGREQYVRAGAGLRNPSREKGGD